MLADLQKAGIEQTSLLVVPNFHKQEPLEQSGQFIEQLRSWQNSGHELVLHSHFHIEDVMPRNETLREKITANIYTAGEGEFYRLDKQTADSRLRAGLETFKKLGLRTHGFIAAAWLYSHESIEAIRLNSFGYFTTLKGIQDLKSDRFIQSRAIVWSHRSAFRRLTSNLALPYMANNIIRKGTVLRLALHPPDFDHSSIKRCFFDILDIALENGYRPRTYADCLDLSSV